MELTLIKKNPVIIITLWQNIIIYWNIGDLHFAFNFLFVASNPNTCQYARVGDSCVLARICPLVDAWCFIYIYLYFCCWTTGSADLLLAIHQAKPGKAEPLFARLSSSLPPKWRRGVCRCATARPVFSIRWHLQVQKAQPYLCWVPSTFLVSHVFAKP